MNLVQLGKWAWIAIYVGMVLLALGISLVDRDAGFGWSVGAVGSLGIVVGAVMIWIRSRHPDGP